MLARPGKEIASRLPDPEGMRLWRMFHEQHMGRLAVVIDEDIDRSHLEHWFKVNGVKAAVYEVLDVNDPQMKAEKVQRLAMTVGRSDWYIDTDPVVAAITLRLGIPTLLVANPYIVRPEWTGTKAARSWDDLVEEIDHQAELRASKTWGDVPGGTE